MDVVAGIWRYPVKSMQGERVDHALVDDRGVIGDRGRALIDLDTGKVASGSWAAKRWGDLVTWSASYVQDPVPTEPLPEVRIERPDGVEVMTEEPDVDQTLSQHLGRDIRLAVAGRHPDGAMYGEPPPGTFWDVGPVHVLTTSTLARLTEAMPGAAFDPRRFRPNLLIDTADAPGFPEDAWVGATLTIGSDVHLRVTGRCPRCVMTTHAQGELPKDANILRTAAQSNEANVGVYAEVLVPGVVQVGDAAAVTPSISV